MAGQQFQYDDSGNTFFYFLTSFVGLIVIPATYYLWPRDQHAEQIRLKNIRNVYGRCLWYRLRLLKPQQNIIPTVKKIVLLAGWALFLFLAYKVSKTDREYQEYNPYEVLHLDPGASISEIKKQYRALSLKYHPDKGGDEVMFMRIAKAYAALTDEESRKNWEEFGNPDGPQATSFGIALPAWIVDQKNSILVLLVYGLAFMVILPVVVGSWWYRSIRYSGDQILIRTTQIYTYFVYKTRNMDMKRLIMVLAGASEFDPQYNKDATSRPADNIQIPQLIREIGGINLKKNEPPLTCPYSLKARVLLLTHLARMKVPEVLEEDQQFILKKSPALLQEMINVICQLIIMARSREEREFRAPSLGSLENCMKLSQMTVQGLQQFKSPLLQLPHIEEDNLRRVSNHKKYKIKSIQDLVSLKGSDRRNLLHFLEDKKYDEVMAVLGSFPYVTMDIKPQVLDDEDSNNITVGSLVTVLVTLTRQTMAEVFEKEQSICAAEEQPTEDGQGDVNKVKSKGWQQKNKGTKKASKSKKKKPLKKKPVPPSLQPPKQQKQKQANGEVVAKEEEEEISDKGSESEEEETNRDSQSEKDDGSDRDSDREQDEKQNKDDEAEWQELQQSIQRKERALLETKSKITHPVYSLFFPEEKQEWWWLYIADRKEQMLICMPYHVCTLKDKEEVELKFPAPGKPGNYQYTVYLRSDSYMGLDQIKPLKLEVHEAKPVPENHPQWDTAIEGDEDQEDSEGFEDSFEEEEEEEEDDD
ncbi:translocation protein SEC63 homolog [Haliaeetus albicilla]|uniref:Translocation protein SEC63 homolog n=2 Tax=Accipitrinae TaxID=8955 RepID=A0A663ECW2_AQUCH|nr:PREDICTED: translocation protein SEC63 homolog isoform X1 [Haliaeetus leucocephalus]XP_029898381.1 translocation protein SEC63 homolog [Aquila chrysaetos chrysaetos]XP_049673757.1 translocation protein SEC63 homolog [Accipiter gentilis]